MGLRCKTLVHPRSVGLPCTEHCKSHALAYQALAASMRALVKSTFIAVRDNIRLIKPNDILRARRAHGDRTSLALRSASKARCPVHRWTVFLTFHFRHVFPTQNAAF